MKRIAIKTRTNEVMLIPTAGWLIQMNYINGKKRVRIAFGWLHIRASIVLWEPKGYFDYE